MIYTIIRAFIVYQSGQNDIMENEFETNDLEAERIRLTAQFSCKSVYFTFTEKPKMINNDTIPEAWNADN